MRGSWARAFLEARRGDLRSTEARAALTAAAIRAERDIASIEVLHGTIRRWPLHRSHQTDVMSFTGLSTEWVSQRVRCAQ
eukprot:4192024-Pyramimonas_sp.AAC.1